MVLRLQSTEKITNVANRVKSEKENGHDIVVVVSAMGKTTDELSNLAFELSESPTKREMDMLLIYWGASYNGFAFYQVKRNRYR